MKKITLVSCLLIVLALLVSSRWATAVDAPPQDTLPVANTSLAVALSVQDMVNQSDVIAIGNCVETKTVWVDRSLVTFATVSVSESLKGNESSTIHRLRRLLIESAQSVDSFPTFRIPA